MRPAAAAASLVRMTSLRHRRWHRLLAGLTLDPAVLSQPLEEPGANDFLICGLPRSGTSLLTAQLFQPPAIATVMEPWDALRLPPAPLFASLRQEIADAGELRRGRLDVSALVTEGVVRWCRDGERSHEVHLTPDYLLGVKFPAFWRYLDLLPTTKFLVCLRDPVEVIASFGRQTGRLAEGLEYDVPFNREMNDWLVAATDDLSVRRILMVEYIASRILPHVDRPNVMVVRYERWFSERSVLQAEISGFLGVPMGDGHAAIRARGDRRAPTPDEKAEIDRHCPSLRALGY